MALLIQCLSFNARVDVYLGCQFGLRRSNQVEFLFEKVDLVSEDMNMLLGEALEESNSEKCLELVIG